MTARPIAVSTDQAALRLYRRAHELVNAAAELLAAARELLLHAAAPAPPPPPPAAGAGRPGGDAARSPVAAAPQLAVAMSSEDARRARVNQFVASGSARGARGARGAQPRAQLDLDAANAELQRVAATRRK